MTFSGSIDRSNVILIVRVDRDRLASRSPGRWRRQIGAPTVVKVEVRRGGLVLPAVSCTPEPTWTWNLVDRGSLADGVKMSSLLALPVESSPGRPGTRDRLGHREGGLGGRGRTVLAEVHVDRRQRRGQAAAGSAADLHREGRRDAVDHDRVVENCRQHSQRHEGGEQSEKAAALEPAESLG
jgi:hypothetical protein